LLLSLLRSWQSYFPVNLIRIARLVLFAIGSWLLELKIGVDRLLGRQMPSSFPMPIPEVLPNCIVPPSLMKEINQNE
jgi:hypothetical protein